MEVAEQNPKKKEVYEYGTLVAIGFLALVGFYFLLPDLKKPLY